MDNLLKITSFYVTDVNITECNFEYHFFLFFFFLYVRTLVYKFAQVRRYIYSILIYINYHTYIFIFYFIYNLLIINIYL